MKKATSTTKLTLAAMSAAISTLLVYAASILPTGRIGLMFAASLAMWIPLNEKRSVGYAILSYIVCGALSFVLSSNKIYSILYIGFFGLYGFIKFGMDKLTRDKLTAFILKLITCNIIGIAGIVISFKAFDTDLFALIPEFPTWVIIIAIELSFVVYEVVYSLCVNAFDKSLRSFLMQRNR